MENLKLTCKTSN